MGKDESPLPVGRVADEAPPPGIIKDSNLAIYATESLAEVGISLIPVVGGAITTAWEKGRARRQERAQHDRDLFLYRLSLSVQDQVDQIGEQVESLAARLDETAIQDLIGQGVEASVGKTDPEITGLAEAVGRVITARGGDMDEDAPVLLGIVSSLHAGDVGVLRGLVTAVRPGDIRTTGDISDRLKMSALRVEAAMLRLDAADLVNRVSARAGEATWTPTILGVQIAEAMGETAVQRLPDGWTQADADLLNTLTDLDAANPAAIPSLDDMAQQVGRTRAELDASGQVLESAGYLKRLMTLGSQYAYALVLDDTAHVWKAEQDTKAWTKTCDEIMQALRDVPDGQMTGSQELASRLNLNPRLVQAVLRRLVRAGYLNQLDKEPKGPLHVAPTEKLRRESADVG